MSTKFNLALASVGFVGLLSTACTSSNGLEEKETIGTVQQAHEWHNGLSVNGLSVNGLSVNGLSVNGLSVNGLSVNGLSSNDQAMLNLKDAYAQQLFQYIVSCALPANHHFELTIEGQVVSFYGSLGLAPEWEGDEGNCEGLHCQTWVSACVLSRLNYFGQHVDISMRGATDMTQGNPPALGAALKTSQSERNTYTVPEATYYGNLFPNPPVRYACTIGGSTKIERVCGPGSSTPEAGAPYAGCIVNVLGDCAEVMETPDGGAPDGGTVSRCEGPDLGDDNYGSFGKCRAGTPLDGTHPQHVGTVTVYRMP